MKAFCYFFYLVSIFLHKINSENTKTICENLFKVNKTNQNDVNGSDRFRDLGRKHPLNFEQQNFFFFFFEILINY